MLPLQGAGFDSLVGELRSHMPHGKKKNKNTERINLSMINIWSKKCKLQMKSYAFI